MRQVQLNWVVDINEPVRGQIFISDPGAVIPSNFALQGSLVIEIPELLEETEAVQTHVSDLVRNADTRYKIEIANLDAILEKWDSKTNQADSE